MVDFHKELLKLRARKTFNENLQSIDYETKNSQDYKLAVRPFHPHTSIFSYCIGHIDGTVDIRRLDNRNKEENNYNFQLLKKFWNDTSIIKISHNSKFEYAMTRQAGIDIPENTVLHDTMIQHMMLKNLSLQNGLAHLCYEYHDPEIYIYLGKKFNSRELDSYVHKEGKRLRGFDRIPKDLFDIYQLADGQRAILLHQLFFPEIACKEKLLSDYYNELDLIKVTYDMEKIGLMIDRERCEELIEWLQRELYELPHQIEKEIGYFVNLGSDKQVAHVLFSQYGFPILEFTDKGIPSTDKDVLIELKNLFPDAKIIDLILKHRSYTKGLANIQSYIDFANDDNIIHHNIRTNGAWKTGRQSASDPNLQNVEKATGMKNLYPVPARQCFIAPPECFIVAPDYSGIELRLILEASQCVKMLDNLKNGLNPHVIFCEIMYGKHVPESKRFISKKETPSLYDSGKNGHFCLGYGGAMKKLAQTLGLTIEEASIGRALYKKEFPEIVDLIKNGIEKINETGYIETAFGRILYIEKDKLYSWLNYFIQGTAAGILKRAQVRIHKYLIDNWKNSGINLVLCIHDELLIVFPRKMLIYRNEILNDIKRIMITMPEIKVALDVEFKYTKTSWAEMKPLKIG